MSNPKCTAYTRRGEPCQNTAMDGSDFCHVHQAVGDRNYDAAIANSATAAALQHQLEAVHTTLNDLETRGQALRDDARAEYMRTIEQLRQRAHGVREQYALLSASGKEALDEVWSGYRRAWAALLDGIEKARGG